MTPKGLRTQPLRSSDPGVVWPAIQGKTEAQLAATLFQLEQTQWWPHPALEAQQFAQLRLLVEHAYASTTFFRERLDEAGYKTGQEITPEFWRSLPLLERTDIQSDPSALRSQQVPKTHGTVGSSTTSGSTGQVLRVYSTKLNEFFWMAFALREHLWHQRDLLQKLCIIRYMPPGAKHGAPPHGTVARNWGAPTTLLYQTGPAATLDINSDTDVQVGWLQKHQPGYLLTYPSNLEALARYCLDKEIRLVNLQEIRTISEIVTPALRELCAEAFAARIVDIYSSNELGYIATQCPDCQQYHIQSENVLCEILNDRGEPCAPGESGRIVATALHNYAMPLLRYEIRDYAVVGDPGLCKRGLPPLQSILGRSRNMLTMPSGAKRWPTGFLNWGTIAPIAQYQIIQHDITALEAKLVTYRALTAEEELRLTRSIEENYGFRFDITFTYLETVRGHENGKFEEFISRVA